MALRGLQIATIILFGLSAYGADWSDHEQNLRGLEGRVQALRSEIATKMQQSALSADPAHKRVLMAEIEVLEEELEGEMEKMQLELKHVKYEHPERGQELHFSASDFNLILPPKIHSTQHLERLLSEAQDLLQRAYGSTVEAARSLASEVASRPLPPADPRWVLEK